jgi:septal ring factor EnvC (AmiA/AmiB activator)
MRDVLNYIIESPPQEHGGFHPTTVEAAKWAVAEIDRLRAELADAVTLRQSEIESRNREIASLRAELAEKERECEKFLRAAERHAADLIEAREQNAKLRALIENAKAETRGWTTGGYPEPFMQLAARLYHALDVGRGEGTK